MRISEKILATPLGGRVCGERADLGSRVSLKFLFGFVNQSFSFSVVCTLL